MITKQRKIIYIVIIAVLVLASVGLVWQNLKVVPIVNLIPTNNQTSLSPQETGKPATYVLPKVFPNDTKFDLSVFKSSVFGTLIPSEEIKVDASELGRDNPFKKY